MKRNVIIDGCVFSEGHFQGYVPEVEESGLSAFFLTVPFSEQGFREAQLSIGHIYRLVKEETYRLCIARNVQDLFSPDIAIILTFQDPNPIENKLNFLDIFYELGVRVIQLTYNKGSYFGSGCTEGSHGGLTDLGRKAVKRMNELGILVDLSHCNKKTALEALAVSEVPVVFSHANVRSISENPRNKTDEEIRLVAETGGVVGLTPWGPICWKGGDTPPTLDDYLDHVDYVVDLVGIDHVSFGTDNTIDERKDLQGIVEQSTHYPEVVAAFDKKLGSHLDVRYARGFQGIVYIKNVIGGLKERGYGEEDIHKFLGNNLLRVMESVWK